MRTLKLFVLVSTVLFLSVSYVYSADSKTQTSTVTLGVPESAKLSIVSGTVTKTLAQGTENETAFDNGYVDMPAGTPTLTVSANKKWALSARTSTFSGPYAKSQTDLMLKDAGTSHVTNGFGIFKSLDLTDQEISSYAGAVKQESHPIQYNTG